MNAHAPYHRKGAAMAYFSNNQIVCLEISQKFTHYNSEASVKCWTLKCQIINYASDSTELDMFCCPLYHNLREVKTYSC